MMKTVIQRVVFPENRRVLMISDIHGHCSGLKYLLKKADFCKDDILVIVGDLIEKGPESLQTLRFVMDLCQHYTVYPLIGNVDLWRLQMLMSEDPETQQKLLRYSLKAEKWWNTSVLGEMCAEIGVALSPDLDTKSTFPRLQKHFEKEFSFLLNMPTILETQDMIFVHGGIPHENLPELEKEDCFPLLKRDCFLEEGHAFSKYAVVGHWPVLLYCPAIPCAAPIIDEKQRIISLDGGMGLKDNGQLNLLIMDKTAPERFRYEAWDDLPVITALEAQDASEDSFYLHWARDPVTVTPISAENDMTRVLYQGHELLVPSHCLREKDGLTYCDDVTDYHLPVSPGDTLKLIYTTSYGCYAKKGSTTGWYCGKYV
ncbi:MAG: metallophosphoesterase [Clostridia bacterium]|nr:metallophosphoesterase [Clostridia bacterium]